MEYREPPPPLAAAWVTKKNRAGTHFYFYNQETGEVSLVKKWDSQGVFFYDEGGQGCSY
jgi:hypothetical protein